MLATKPLDLLMPHPVRARYVLQLAVAVLFVLLVPAPLSSAAAAAGRPPSMATAAESVAALYALEAALNAHDEDAVVGRFTADAHLTDGAVYLGTDQVHAWARAAIADDVWLELADAPDIGPTSGLPLVGDWAVAPVWRGKQGRHLLDGARHAYRPVARDRSDRSGGAPQRVGDQPPRRWPDR